MASLNNSRGKSVAAPPSELVGLAGTKSATPNRTRRILPFIKERKKERKKKKQPVPNGRVLARYVFGFLSAASLLTETHALAWVPVSTNDCPGRSDSLDRRHKSEQKLVSQFGRV